MQLAVQRESQTAPASALLKKDGLSDLLGADVKALQLPSRKLRGDGVRNAVGRSEDLNERARDGDRG